jgi:ubiquinone biosynthesis monooxygenase Coq7
LEVRLPPDRHPISAREALTIGRIVKVNHAGEYGAIRIYSAQIKASAKRYPEIVAALADMLAHEKKHCAAFAAAMPQRNTRPCRVMTFWGFGGWLLGFLTAQMGRQAIWVCTAAVEGAVHRHLDEQLEFLAQRDVELHRIILEIREEELSHLHYAETHIESNTRSYRLLSRIIADATEVLIWLSTWGDSSRMKKELRDAM